MAFSTYTYQDLMNMIPEYTGENHDGLLSFILEIDTIIRTVDPAAPAQHRLITQVARRQLKGRARDYIATAGTTWADIRKVLMTMCAPASKTTLHSQLISCQQGNQSVDHFYTKVNNIVRDLILLETGGLSATAAATKTTEIVNQAKTSFIEGLESSLSNYVYSHEPENLIDAMTLAIERERFLNSNLNQVASTSTPQSPTGFLKEIHEVLNQILYKLTPPVENEPSSRLCHLCNKPGHIARACKEYPLFCEYHRLPVHSTAQCKALRNDYEENTPQMQPPQYTQPLNQVYCTNAPQHFATYGAWPQGQHFDPTASPSIYPSYTGHPQTFINQGSTNHYALQGPLNSHNNPFIQK